MPTKIIVTDVTEMHGGNFCVAGWDATANRMVRPIPQGGTSWAADKVDATKFFPGNIVIFVTTGQATTGDMPHTTEDTFVNVSSLQFGLQQKGWIGQIADSASKSLKLAFGGHSSSRSYDGERYHVIVPRGRDCPSLGAIIVAADQIEFFVDDRKKLRARVTDSDATYKLPIVGHALNELHRNSGVSALNKAFDRGKLHVRLGLARAYSEYPDECFVMVNGVYTI